MHAEITMVVFTVEAEDQDEECGKNRERRRDACVGPDKSECQARIAEERSLEAIIRLPSSRLRRLRRTPYDLLCRHAILRRLYGQNIDHGFDFRTRKFGGARVSQDFGTDRRSQILLC